MENNLENKAKFFALYVGQRVLGDGLNNSGLLTLSNIKLLLEYSSNTPLELKPLSSITDEDAIGVVELITDEHYKSKIKNTDDKIYLVNTFIANDLGFWSFRDVVRITDYLRFKGYAVPWMGLLVEQLIEYGWVKLTTLN